MIYCNDNNSESNENTKCTLEVSVYLNELINYLTNINSAKHSIQGWQFK